MAPFSRKYGSRERAAIVAAYTTHPAKRVVAMASAGDLSDADGQLEPFQLAEGTVRDLARKSRRAETGRVRSPLADVEHRDAIEELRVRLVSAADAVLAVEEAKSPGRRNLERMRQVARVIHAASSIPGLRDPRPPMPELRGGIGGRILHGQPNGTPKGLTPLGRELMAEMERTREPAATLPPPASEPRPASTPEQHVRKAVEEFREQRGLTTSPEELDLASKFALEMAEHHPRGLPGVLESLRDDDDKTEADESAS